MTNYRPIPVLPRFSKTLERIMYNRPHKYLTENNSSYCKQLGFPKGHSPEHAILQLVEKINQSFKKNEFVLIYSRCVCWFIQNFRHSRPSNLTNKVEYYGIAWNNLSCFKNCVKDQKRFISFDHNSTKKATVTCSAPQGSILGLLLFLLYVNDLHHASKVLDPIMFADDTNLFFSHSDINVLFEKMNKEVTNFSN